MLLDLFWAEPSTGIRILQQAANIVHCTLLFSTNDNISNHPNHPPIKITLPSLESLVLRNPHTRTTGETVRGFLAALVAPALLRLEIPEAFLEQNPVDSLASFISTSNCKCVREINITERTLRMSRGAYETTYRVIFPSIQFSFEYDNDSSDEESD
ncbi:hypothetical protein B0H14DRAFT_2605878 [Mycena olivaceomarginata]|nr:hypothetical protein B0H14DRAFT_2605878 [Mycena olivaceomarginata]